MRRPLSSLVVILALMCIRIAHAEGGCPPGQHSQSGQGWQTCVPIPGANSDGSISRAITHIPSTWSPMWGAIVSGGKDQIGISSEKPSESSAIAAAMDECISRGGANCKLSHVYANQCMAVIGRPGAAAVPSDASNEQTAISDGMSKCAADGISGCWVFYSGCSLPIEVPK